MSAPLSFTADQQKTLSASTPKGAILPCQERCVDLEYLHAHGTPVSGAAYVIASYDGQILYQGKLDQQGRAHIEGVSPTLTGFVYYFKDDPLQYVPLRQPSAVADREATQSMLDAILSWIWGTLQGDFNKDPSTSQIVVNTVLGVIPLVDQALDVRDLIAGLKDIIEYYSEDEARRREREDMLGLSYETWLWINAFVIALGCIPELGSVIKGVLKGLFNFLIAASKQAGELQPKQLQEFWQSLVAILNNAGRGNASAWLKDFNSKLDGWINEAATKLNGGLDAIKSLLTKVEDYTREYRSLIERIVDERTLAEFNSHLQRIKRALASAYARMEAAKAQVNQWLHAQISKMLEGKHHFEMSGASGTPTSPVRNIRTQEARDPPDFVNPAKPREVSPEELKNPKPSTAYTINGYTYKTDAQGRVVEASGKLKLEKADRNRYAQQQVGKSVNETGDDGGHLIGSRFGGSGEKINMVPQDSNLNRSSWKTMENRWATALEEGKSVEVSVKPIYSGDSPRPIGFRVLENVGGKTKTSFFENKPGG